MIGKKIEILFYCLIAMPLMVKCKSCDKIFVSQLQMIDTSNWHKPIISSGISQDCPDCGKKAIYNKEDHFFQ